MTHDDKTVFCALMTGMAQLFNEKLSNPTLEIYWQLLKSYALSDIQRALHTHLRDPERGQFKPKPADMIRHMECSPSHHALQAWTKLVKAMKQVGAYTSVVFDDPLIHVVVEDMGGWVSLCKEKEFFLCFKQKEFEKRYNHYVSHPPTQYPNRLTGRLERHQPMVEMTLVYIGDVTRAQRVFQEGMKLPLPFLSCPCDEEVSR